MIYIWKNSMSIFCGPKEMAIDAGCIEITDEEYKQLKSGESIWKNDKIVKTPDFNKKNKTPSREEVRREINRARAKLKSTDEKIIEYVEGILSEDEFKSIKELRKQLRAEIKENESRL